MYVQIVLGYPPNSQQNQWSFTRVQDTQVGGIAVSPLAVHKNPSPVVMHPSSPITPEMLGAVQVEQGTSDVVKNGAVGEESSENETEEKTLEDQLAHEKQRGEEQHLSSEPRMQAMYFDPLFIYSTMLPRLNLTPYDALVVDLPLCSSPTDYVCADANHVNNVVQELFEITQRDEFYHVKFAGSMIYRVKFYQSFCACVEQSDKSVGAASDCLHLCTIAAVHQSQWV